MNKRLFLFIPALCLFLLALLPEQKKTFLPFKGTPQFFIKTYIDYIDTTRKSMGTATLTDSLLTFDYTLHTVNNNEAIKPISGVNIWFDVNATGSFVDVHNYEYLDIEIAMKEAASFVMHLKTFEHFTDTTKWETLRYTEKEISLNQRISRYRLRFKEFTTPNWWKSIIGTRVLTLPKEPDYRKLMGIDFQNNPGGQLNVPERIEIRKIEFRKDRRLFYSFTIGGGLLWTLFTALFMLVYRSKKPVRQTTEKPIKPVTLVNQTTEQLDRLITFIGSHYQTPDISVEMVSKETGIALPKISTVLQQKYQIGFKQYLNDVRITEAKRLLIETDRTIAEVAFAVGYNSIPHFNRVFRQQASLTPTEYREQGRRKANE